MPGEVDSDRLDLELTRNLDWQDCPGIDVGAWVMKQDCDVRSVPPAKPAQYRSPRKIFLNRIGAGSRPVAYVPHSLCL